jgi:hypothetical protein
MREKEEEEREQNRNKIQIKHITKLFTFIAGYAQRFILSP